MKYFKLIMPAFYLFALTSCDFSMYTAVRNYKEPCKVNVVYNNTGSLINNSDTLLVKNIDDAKPDSQLVRTNTSSNAYYFTAPQKKEIALRPVALAQPIKQVQMTNSSGSTWEINFSDKKQFKKLRKSGQIKTKGFIFTNTILIENK